MLNCEPYPSQDSYYADNYTDYQKQNPPHKIRFYVDLVERWLRRGELIFELGVRLKTVRFSGLEQWILSWHG